MGMTFLKDEQLANAVRFSKRDNRILAAFLIIGIIAALLGLYFLNAYSESDTATWFVVLVVLGITMVAYPIGVYAGEALFPGSSIGLFGHYRIVHVKPGVRYVDPEDPSMCIVEAQWDRWIVEYAEPKLFYGYEGRWWVRATEPFNDKKQAKEAIKALKALKSLDKE